MHNPTLRIVREGCAASELIERVAGAWPGEVVRSEFDAQDWPNKRDAAVLVAIEDATRARHVAERLHDAQVPGVVLFPGIPENAGRDGVMFVSCTQSADAVLARLEALAHRQPLVVSMAQEIRISDAAQAGATREMNRIHEELTLASTIQRQFIPKVMPLAGCLAFGSLFRPTGYVSGDIFDVRPADDEHTAFFLADVVGHGVPAALLTMVVSRAMVTRERTGGQWHASTPSAALARVNRELCQHPEGPHRFATAIYGLISNQTGRITLAGAGHPPPLVLGGALPRKIETDGPMLGVFDEAEFPDVTFDLQPGETLVLHSDGIEVAFPREGAQGRDLKLPTDRYLAELASLWADSNDGLTPEAKLEQAFATLAQRLNDQTGSLHQQDDVTVLAMTRLRTNAMGMAA